MLRIDRIAAVALLAWLPFSVFPAEKITELKVYTAKKILTMEPTQPEATAVAISNGRIVSVGSPESLESWTSRFPTTVDETFKDKVLLPGFIDPHLHPTLPAILTLYPFIAPEDWSLPAGEFPAARSNAEYLEALKREVARYPESPYYEEGIPFITWGYPQLFHGDVFQDELDELFPETPVMLWHRSFHELILNTAAVELVGITEEETRPYGVDIEWDKGRFTEFGAKTLLVPRLVPLILTAERYATGMENFVRMMHLGGVTSGMDMGIGTLGNPEDEVEAIRAAVNAAETPARIVLTPQITDFMIREKSPEEALAEVKRWEERWSTGRVRLDGHFKIFMDGAAFSGLGQMGFPGYMDGHDGIWMLPLERTYAFAKTFWNAGYQIHAHTNGDLSAGMLMEFVRRLQAQHLRVDHRTVLEHFMYAKEDQLAQMADLGMAVSANPYYQYILADIYAEQWLGEDRARNMFPLGAAVRAGVRTALHSDAPMAPLSPLTLVWTAVNRKSIGGTENNATERLTLDQALRGVTIDAAWMMRQEDELGSIRAGKIADFTVLDADPYEVAPAAIKDIEIWGTVFEGVAYPIER